MKLFLYKIFLLSRSKDQGFTLPMVIGIGLIMVLLSSMSLLQASEENLTSVYKTQSATSLAMAELGVARYRELLNNNRFLAVNSLANWSAVDNQTCDAISASANGWADNTDTGWRNVQLDETVIGSDVNNNGNATDVNATIGSYRIINYVYQNDDDVTDDDDPIDPSEDWILDPNNFIQTSDADNPDGPRGLLTVQGRVPSNDSVAQIQVTIPIGVNTNDLVALNPGIWINQSTVANLGDLNFTAGNLVLYKDGNSCADANLAGITAIRDPRNLPPLAPDPNGLTNFNDLVNDINGEMIIGKPSDDSNSDDGTERYYYRVDGNLNIGDGDRLITDGTARVLVYVTGNLDISGEVDITNSSNDATSRFLEIHVNGNVTISGSETIDIKGLIHAPNGTVDITGSPTINLTGSIWANDWSNASVNPVTIQTDEYEFYSVTPQRTPKPLTFAPTGWEQQQVN